MTMSTSRNWKFASREHGNVAIEYALVLPVMLLFILGIIDTGRFLWTNSTLYRSVEAAARCGAVNTIACNTTTQIKSRAVAEAWGLSVDPSNFTVTTPACGIRVAATYSFKFIIPGVTAVVPLGMVTLNATACYPPVA